MTDGVSDPEEQLDIGILDVNTIHPALDIHEHFMIQTGFGTLCISSCTT